jgi:hypothetical protein
MHASREGWKRNFANPEKYPDLFMTSFFNGTGRTVENEIFFNKAQQPLIEGEKGILGMTSQGISDNISTLSRIGLAVSESMFDSSILENL